MQVLARLCDQSLFWELMPDAGEEMVCGVGRVGGLYAGFIINRQGLVGDPERPGNMRPGGTLYRAGIAKISAFSRACDSDGIPIVWLQDISGFDIGVEAERQGLLAYGSNLIYTNSTNTVPMFTVLLRKASGAGYYAMAGLPYDPVVQLSTCITRLSVMEGRTLAIATYNTKLDDDFKIISQDPAERAKIEADMLAVEKRIEADMDPYVSAAPDGHRRDRRARRAPRLPRRPRRDELPKHRLPPHQKPADLDHARPRRAHRGDPLMDSRLHPPTLLARLVPLADGKLRLESPTVGLYREAPRPGSLVTPDATDRPARDPRRPPPPARPRRSRRRRPPARSRRPLRRARASTRRPRRPPGRPRPRGRHRDRRRRQLRRHRLRHRQARVPGPHRRPLVHPPRPR
jgi:hypothetical protein